MRWQYNCYFIDFCPFVGGSPFWIVVNRVSTKHFIAKCNSLNIEHSLKIKSENLNSIKKIAMNGMCKSFLFFTLNWCWCIYTNRNRKLKWKLNDSSSFINRNIQIYILHIFYAPNHFTQSSIIHLGCRWNLEIYYNNFHVYRFTSIHCCQRV